jgi:cyclophilin family peptidyl-prolyl cis-trans isomerase
MVQAGDPNTREGAVETWGTGGTTELPFESSGLWHFPLALASAKATASPDALENSSQFYVTTESAHHLDGKHTVFGTLIEGESVLHAIAAGTIAEGSADRPVEPVVIKATEVL